jgi:hypothetical protein
MRGRHRFVVGRRAIAVDLVKRSTRLSPRIKQEISTHEREQARGSEDASDALNIFLRGIDPRWLARPAGSRSLGVVSLCYVAATR